MNLSGNNIASITPMRRNIIGKPAFASLGMVCLSKLGMIVGFGWVPGSQINLIGGVLASGAALL
jgi:hypothetical protein